MGKKDVSKKGWVICEGDTFIIERLTWYGMWEKREHEFEKKLFLETSKRHIRPDKFPKVTWDRIFSQSGNVLARYEM